LYNWTSKSSLHLKNKNTVFSLKNDSNISFVQKNLIIKAIRYIFTLGFLLFYCFNLFGQKNTKKYGFPLIQNFSGKDYRGDNVIWSAVQDEIGNMYFANKNGVLKYNGNSWSNIEIIKETISISYDSTTKTIFVGCVEDFGCIRLNQSGKSKYVSLADSMKRKDKIGYVWDCMATPEGIFFMTKNELIRYKNGTYKTWNSQDNFHTSFYAGGKLFVREKGVGLLYLEGEHLTFLNGSELFAENRIEFIGSSSINSNEFILASREKGLFKFELEKSKTNFKINLKTINKNTADLFSKNLISRGIRLSDNNYAFSTLFGGLIVIDINGNLLMQLNIKNGLNCDLINGIFEDSQGSLWLSTENGISLVMYSLSTYNFEHTGNISGTVESMAKLGEDLYVSSSMGIYKLNKKLNGFEKLDFPSIQVWHLVKIMGEESLIAATSQGIYKINSNGFSLISAETDNFYTITQSKKHPNIYFIGHSNGFSTYRYVNGQMKLISKNSNISFAIRSILEDKNGNLWLSTQYDGVIYMLTSESDINEKINYINFIQYSKSNITTSIN